MKLQDFAKFNQLVTIQPQRATIEIPAFTLAVPPWTGASLILAEYPLGNDYYLSLRVPISPFGANFIAAVRWTVGEVTTRYKLFNHAKGVLYFPRYTGERIGLSAVLEIWSVNSVVAPALSANKTLQVSVLAFPNNCACCENPNSNQLLLATPPSVVDAFAYCNPFCDILETP